ncbi:MAG: helix-turn-helix domain-containing protein [Candidatus Competibacteraceae bacterium]|nr:helix-turn-helix domain-containing protein [Candidatus Competibacteraceae bacterium]
MNTYQDALQSAVLRAGGQTHLAKAIGLKQGHIWFWLKRGRIPAERVLAVEAATGISRHELRPDIYPEPDRPA